MIKNSLSILIACLALFPALSFGQAPALGTAAGFVIFSSTGAIVNTGTTSQITGNVATLNGSITIGVNVNGVLYPGTAVSAVAADVLSAYNQLSLTVPTDTQKTGTNYTLGNGDTLYAGVDSIAMNTLLDDTLVLDGQNNADPVFIFKIHGTFSSTTGAVVILTHGAKACNVFWQVDGEVNMASKTRMRGTIIANSAAIDLGDSVLLEGRALTSTAGAISTTSVLAYLPIGCGSAVLTGPSAPALGTTACFALFTGNGANTNSGITNVTGDVGTNVGLTTGYDPLLVNGTIHPIADSWTAAAATDLGIAYTYLNTLTPDIELLFPPLFGHNLVLTPHIYLMNAATALTDTLYLNAEGNTNAVFVIQINGALSTSTHAKIILINGTQAKNVYWKVDGAVNLNDYADFKGTIIANNGAISLGTGVILDGRALTTDGEFTTAAATATIPPLTCFAALPVNWLYFTGRAVDNYVLLDWGTANTRDNGYYSIEKSPDAMKFELLSTINAVNEKGNAENHYSITDRLPYNPCYYRISQTDNSGQKTYYHTIQVNSNALPVSQPQAYLDGNHIIMQYQASADGNGFIVLYSIDGRKVSTQPIVMTKNLGTYSIEKPTQSGMYILSIEGQGVKRYNAKIMVN